jgi:SIR2-like domain
MNDSKILFFFGAGASVPAGVKGVVGLTKDLKEWLQEASKSNELQLINKIEEVLQRRTERKIDVELLLETIEKLEKSGTEVLLDFYENKKPTLPELDNIHLSEQIKQFIREKCFISATKTSYLEPLLHFTQEYTLIFSTNYDNSVEQFCDIYGLSYVDGFDNRGWNFETFMKLDGGIRLYKLHGSITWYRTEKGDYKSIQIRNNQQTILLADGQTAIPYIVYPGRKFEYSEPLIDVVPELKNQLGNKSKVNVVFVVGYAFKDTYLATIFRYAAAKNTELIIFLISPSAYSVYEQKLKFHQDDDLTHTPSRTPGNSTPRIPSHLSGRVICLNYGIENIISHLKTRYLVALRQAQGAERVQREHQIKSENTKWNDCIKYYVDCEHIERASEIIEEGEWSKFVYDDWKWSFEISLKGLLTCLLNEKDDIINRWHQYLERVLKKFSFENFVFNPDLDMQTPSFPPYINLEFRNHGSNISSRELAQTLCLLIQVMEDKLQLIKGDKKHKKIIEFLDRESGFFGKLVKFIQYLNAWSEEKMTFEKYYNIRYNHPDEIEQFKRRSNEFKTIKQNEEGQQRVREIVELIESNEIRKIYGSDNIW